MQESKELLLLKIYSLVNSLKIVSDNLFMNLALKEEYLRCQKNESLRQQFLDNFLKQNPNKSVLNLVYDSGGQKFKDFLNSKLKRGAISKKDFDELIFNSTNHELKDFDALAFSIRSSFGTGNKIPIFVRPYIFDFSFEDLFIILRYHEFVHAEHAKFGIKFKEGLEYNYLVAPSFDYENVALLDESVAYCTSILNAIERKHFSSFISGCCEILTFLNSKLEKITSFKSVSEEASIKLQIKNNKSVLLKFDKNKV